MAVDDDFTPVVSQFFLDRVGDQVHRLSLTFYVFDIRVYRYASVRVVDDLLGHVDDEVAFLE